METSKIRSITVDRQTGQVSFSGGTIPQGLINPHDGNWEKISESRTSLYYERVARIEQTRTLQKAS